MEPFHLPADDDEPEPDLREVQQQPAYPVPPLKVEVEGPTYVKLLPARVAVSRNLTVGTDPVKLFSEDARRARALIWGIGSAAGIFHLGPRDDEVKAKTAGRPWASDGTARPQMIEIHDTEAWYAMAETGTVTVCFVLEQWAD